MRALGPIDPDTGAQVVSGIGEWLAPRLPGTVTAYLGMDDEVDVTPLFARLPGWRWVLPRVEAPRTLSFRDRDVPREVHRFGMSQPADIGPVVPIREIDVFLVPGLAFDTRGGRLGRGGGFYDGVLAQKRTDAVAIGVTTARQVVDEVPMDDHDRRVGWLATEDGVSECPPRR